MRLRAREADPAFLRKADKGLGRMRNDQAWLPWQFAQEETLLKVIVANL